MAVHDIARIEEKLDRVAVGNTPVSDTMGGLTFQNMSEVIEFAKLMSLAGNAVPKHLQQNPGMCLAVCIQALEWRMSPFSVANKSYEVQNRLSFESQLVHAVIEQRAPIVGRLRHKFDGEGDDRRCIVSAVLRETGETLEYISPPISKITPKNSPLWKTKSDLQLYYNTSRDFCRAYFPDVLLGVYAQDELRDHVGPDNAKDVSDKPGVAARLKGSKGRGFSASHVERETTRGVVDETTTEPSAPADAEAATGINASAASPNSTPVSAPPAPQESKPAPESSPELTGAGATTSPDGASTAVSGEPKQVAPEGDGAPTNRGDLPVGWEKDYATALNRASKPHLLPKRATEFWADKGGWVAHRDGPNGATASAIYDAFANNFGEPGREAREVILHELNAI